METAPSIRLRDNEPFEVALRRFKKSIEKEGVLSEVKKREAYEKPSVKKKKKAIAARKKAAKTARMYRNGQLEHSAQCFAGNVQRKGRQWDYRSRSTRISRPP